MVYRYTTERNVQMLVYLLKAHNVRKVVVSPGATNISFVASLQQDDWFELYSSVDERSAAYIACGLSYESGEPVVISCTGATASRNYFPGLSEAFYRKLPIIAVTATLDISNAGNLVPQFIDRSIQPKDVVSMSVHLQNIKDKVDEWDVNLKINKALLELRRHGGGPVHINLSTSYQNESVAILPPTRVVNRYFEGDEMPPIGFDKKIAITVGGHFQWNKELKNAVENFCGCFNSVVFIDHSSGYNGSFAVLPTIVTTQEEYTSDLFDIDLLIHIGEQHGDYYTAPMLARAKEVWRVSEDGEIRDPFHKLTNVFEMKEEVFFQHYIREEFEWKNTYYSKCQDEVNKIYSAISELPFSNIWLAKTITHQLPGESVLQLGVSNTMRSWTFFRLPETVQSIANVGCRGIDGALSVTLGMALANPKKIHFCILGDLTFFYDMNALGNRHVAPNMRIMLVNNGKGTEFRLYQHRAQTLLEDEVDPFVAAAGHYGDKSTNLVRHYVTDLGFQYISASSKETVLEQLPIFLDDKIGEKPILFEVFTDSKSESDALYEIRHVVTDALGKTKKIAKQVLGDKGISLVKKAVKR